MERNLIDAGFRSLDDALALVESSSRNLESLILHGNKLHSLRNQKKVQLPKLRSLNLSSNEIQYADFSELSACQGLTNINLAANGMHGLSGIHVLKQLMSLNLSFNALQDLSWLGDGGRDHVSSPLERLDLRDNAISDLRQLYQLQFLPRLKDLRLQACERTGPSPSGGEGPEHGAGQLMPTPRTQAALALSCTSQNPVCANPAYVQTVLAVCPTLRILDGLPVEVWRELLPSLPSMAAPVASPPSVPSTRTRQQEEEEDGEEAQLGAQGQEQQVEVPTPNIDKAASRFLRRYLSPGSTPTVSPSQPPGLGPQGGSPGRGQGMAEGAASSPSTKACLVNLEEKLEQLIQHSSHPPPVVSAACETESVECQTEGVMVHAALLQEARQETERVQGEAQSVQARLQAEAAQLRSERDSLTAQLAHASLTCTAETGRLREECGLLKGQVEGRMGQVAQLKEELARRPTQEVLDAWRQRVSDCEARLASCPSAELVSALQARCAEMGGEVGRLQVALEEEQRAATRHAARADDASAQLVSVSSERDACASSLSRAMSDLSTQQSQHSREMELREREVAAARMAHEQLANQASSALLRAREAELMYASAKASAEEAARVRAASEGAVQDMKQQVDRLQGQLKDVVARAEQEVGAEKTRTAAAISAAEERLSSARAAAEEEVMRMSVDVNGRLQAAREALTQHGLRYAALSKAMGEAQVEIADLRRQVGSSAAGLVERDARIVRLREELSRLEADRMAVQAGQASRESARINELLSKLDAGDATLRSVRDELHTCRAALSSSQAEVRVKEAILADQGETIKKYKREIASTKEQAEAAERGYKEAIGELRVQLEDCRASLDHALAAREEAIGEAERATSLASGATAMQEQLEAVLKQVRAESTASEELRRSLAAKESALTYIEGELLSLKGAYEGKVAAAGREKEEAVAAWQGEKKRVQGLTQEVEELKVKLASTSAALEHSMSALHQARAQSGRAEARCAAQEEEMAVLLRELDAARAASEERARRVASLVAAMQAEVAGGGAFPSSFHSPNHARASSTPAGPGSGLRTPPPPTTHASHGHFLLGLAGSRHS